eukprot:8215225-Alexandrium_andersonii.AAC.1
MGARRRRPAGIASSRAARILGHHARRPPSTVTVVTKLQGKWLIQLIRLLRDARDILHVDFLH